MKNIKNNLKNTMHCWEKTLETLKNFFWNYQIELKFVPKSVPMMIYLLTGALLNLLLNGSISFSFSWASTRFWQINKKHADNKQKALLFTSCYWDAMKLLEKGTSEFEFNSFQERLFSFRICKLILQNLISYTRVYNKFK